MPSPQIFTSIINSYIPEPQAALLNGIIFGVSIKSTHGFYESLKVVGLLHIVVLSGMNITILAALISAMTSWISRLASTLLTIIFIILFIIFVGPQAPIIRAGFMAILTSVSIIYGRKTMALYILVLSAIFIGIFWPEWLSTISFQLSYGATLGIILFYKPQMKRADKAVDRIKKAIRDELRLSLSAQVFTAPIIFLYFKQISVIAPVSNVLVSIFIGPLMALGLLTALLGKISYLLGLVPAYLSYGILSYIVWVVNLLSKFPFVYFKF